VARSTVVIELARDATLSRDLAAGGVFVRGYALRMAEECELVVCGAHRRVSLPARVVYVDEQRGAGLELIGFSTAMRDQLAELTSDALGDDDLAVPIEQDDDDHRTVPVAQRRTPVTSLDDHFAAGDAAAGVDDDFRATDEPIALPDTTDDFDDTPGPDQPPAMPAAAAAWRDEFDDAEPSEGEPVPMQPGDAAAIGNDFADDTGPVTLDPAVVDPDEPPDIAARPAGDSRGARNVHERLRGLNLAAQIKLATSGELHERIVLERLYGKNVWETLLRNPRLTAPEVSRIARYGSLPRVLLDLILANNAWLQVPEVRRALLSNPRLGNDQIMKVLRLVPKHELRLAAVQTAYPQAVRNAAKILLRE
jgi:hypothetical protein